MLNKYKNVGSKFFISIFYVVYDVILFVCNSAAHNDIDQMW